MNTGGGEPTRRGKVAPKGCAQAKVEMAEETEARAELTAALAPFGRRSDALLSRPASSPCETRATTEPPPLTEHDAYKFTGQTAIGRELFGPCLACGVCMRGSNSAAVGVIGCIGPSVRPWFGLCAECA